MSKHERATIQVRVTQKEKDLLEALATKQGMTLSDFLRIIYRQFLDKSLVNVEGKQYVVPTPINITNMDFAQIPVNNNEDNKEWVSYKFKTSSEKKNAITRAADRRNITPNILIRNVLRRWLKAKQEHTEGLGNIPITARKKGAEFSQTISLALTKTERDNLLWYLKQSGHKLAALIDTLVDTVLEHDAQSTASA